MMNSRSRFPWLSAGRGQAMALVVAVLAFGAVSAAPASAQGVNRAPSYQYYWYEFQSVPVYGGYGWPGGYGLVSLQPAASFWWNPFYGGSLSVTPTGAIWPGYPAVRGYYPVYVGYPFGW